MTSFSQDIRPLFRPRDVSAMTFAFDLESYNDVKDNAQSIYRRVSQGSMPCDTSWPEDRVAAFRAWMDEGYPE